MIKAVTFLSHELSNEDKYTLFTDVNLLGNICRRVRDNLYITLFFEDQDATAYCLKYKYMDVVSVDFVPDVALKGHITVVGKSMYKFSEVF